MIHFVSCHTKLSDRDEAGVVLVGLRITQKAGLCDGDGVGVVLVELCLTRKAELHDGDEAGVVRTRTTNLVRSI